MRARAALIGVAGVALVVIAALLWFAHAARQWSGPRVMVNGGDAGGLPRVPPQQEHLDPSALDAASRDAAADGLQVMIVVRHDYLVYERYGRGLDADSVIDSGGFAQSLLALTAGIAAHDGKLAMPSLTGFDAARLRAAIESGTGQNYPDYLSLHLWRRLNAAAAWIALPAAGAAAPADCCFHARVQDWLRVAMLLLADGNFEGKALVPPGWIERMRRPTSADGSAGFGVELAAAAHGAEPFAAEDLLFLRGPGRWRLWVMPTQRLALLFGSSSAASPWWDETRLPNLVLRALYEQPAQRSVGSQLQQLVPGH